MSEKRSENQQHEPLAKDLSNWIASMKPRERILGLTAAGEFMGRLGGMRPEERALLFGAALVANEAMKFKEEGYNWRDAKDYVKFAGREILDYKNYIWFILSLGASVPETLPGMLETAKSVGEFVSNTYQGVEKAVGRAKIGDLITNVMLGVGGLVGVAGTLYVAQKEIWAKKLGPAIDNTRKRSSDFFTAMKDGRVEWQSPLRSPVKAIREVEATPIDPYPKISVRNRN